MKGIIPVQLAMSSRIQEAVNWSWLVPKGLGPTAPFGCQASLSGLNTALAADMLPLPPWVPGGCESVQLPPGNLSVPSRASPQQPVWPYQWRRQLCECDSQTMELKFRSCCGRRTREKQGSVNKSETEVGGT